MREFRKRLFETHLPLICTYSTTGYCTPLRMERFLVRIQVGVQVISHIAICNIICELITGGITRTPSKRDKGNWMKMWVRLPLPSQSNIQNSNIT